jgi:polyketide cyclase/dehydrase/lipid transport protein
MPVDVQTEIEIDRPREEAAAYVSDPDNATAWYKNIKRVEWKSPKPATIGSRVAFVAQFLGRRLEYTYEVKELVPMERVVAPVMARAMRRANEKDLARLKNILEGAARRS